MTLAVIGAGMAGLSCAFALQQAGQQVAVFDKARGAGGRMSSKRSAEGYLDLGAQYFTARQPLFQQQVAQWLKQGVVNRWLAPMYQYRAGQLAASPDAEQRFIGTPAMHSPLRAMADTLECHFNCRVSTITHTAEGWFIQNEHAEQFGPFAQVILAIPPAQAATLLPPPLTVTLPTHLLQPCWAVSLQLSKATQHAAGGIFVKEQALGVSWISRQNSKPGRSVAENWLVHFTPEFSQQHLEQDAVFWQQQAQHALCKILGLANDSISVNSALCHRWLYAQQQQMPDSNFQDAIAPGLWLAGDWTRGGRVENAWLSGYELAQRIQHG
ncbi:NAD(P)/FAD-dependent oxidoreductase [Alishewanella sp. HL-SH05]|uniref:NAD(P)/FAD-dependent oxidoreductase n=1 Tax=Alishewanella sp. HL-SH05 TaxID=3461145 RepID=UPI0040426019